MDRKELEKLAIEFTEAFNREDIDEMMSYFAEDAVYDEFDGRRQVGLAAIRAAFEPQFCGDFGRMRFHAENMFLDAHSGKAMISWLCTLEKGERAGGWRGLDILHFQDGRLVEKRTYAKTRTPDLVKKQDLADWPEEQGVAERLAGGA